jgi:hypothetical protein
VRGEIEQLLNLKLAEAGAKNTDEYVLFHTGWSVQPRRFSVLFSVVFVFCSQLFSVVKWFCVHVSSRAFSFQIRGGAQEQTLADHWQRRREPPRAAGEVPVRGAAPFCLQWTCLSGILMFLHAGCMCKCPARTTPLPLSLFMQACLLLPAFLAASHFFLQGSTEGIAQAKAHIERLIGGKVGFCLHVLFPLFFFSVQSVYQHTRRLWAATCRSFCTAISLVIVVCVVLRSTCLSDWYWYV